MRRSEELVKCKRKVKHFKRGTEYAAMLDSLLDDITVVFENAKKDYPDQNELDMCFRYFRKRIADKTIL